jgi:predicted GNAT superfamily acetyltransferase
VTNTIRDAKPEDYPAILALNTEAIRFLSPMDAGRLAKLARAACYFRVIEHDRRVAAFLMAFRKGAAYDSLNFLWFDALPDDFVYVDRIVIHPDHRGRGLAKALYSDIERFAASLRVSRLACEIDVDPPNPASLAFHDKWGFREIGRQAPYGSKIVSLREKLLPAAGIFR